MQFIEDFFTKFWEKIKAVLEWLIELIQALFKATLSFLLDVVASAFDKILELVVSLLDSIELGSLSGISSAWGGLPDEVINVLGLLGIGEASAIIISAISLRIVLQLVPFTRLGS